MPPPACIVDGLLWDGSIVDESGESVCGRWMLCAERPE